MTKIIVNSTRKPSQKVRIAKPSTCRNVISARWQVTLWSHVAYEFPVHSGKGLLQTAILRLVTYWPVQSADTAPWYSEHPTATFPRSCSPSQSTSAHPAAAVGAGCHDYGDAELVVLAAPTRSACCPSVEPVELGNDRRWPDDLWRSAAGCVRRSHSPDMSQHKAMFTLHCHSLCGHTQMLRSHSL